jgi:hypothetical protein
LRPGGSVIGTVKFPVPVNKSGEKVSPMPLTAPPPFGKEIVSAEVLLEPITDIHLKLCPTQNRQNTPERSKVSKHTDVIDYQM